MQLLHKLLRPWRRLSVWVQPAQHPLLPALDLRDQYLGTYTVKASITTITTRLGAAGRVTTLASKQYTVALTKSAPTQQLWLSGDGLNDLVLRLDRWRLRFSIPKQVSLERTPTGYSYYQRYAGYGTLSGRHLMYTLRLYRKTDQAIIRQIIIACGERNELF